MTGVIAVLLSLFLRSNQADSSESAPFPLSPHHHAHGMRMNPTPVFFPKDEENPSSFPPLCPPLLSPSKKQKRKRFFPLIFAG